MALNRDSTQFRHSGYADALIEAFNGANRISLLIQAFGKSLPGGFRSRLCCDGSQPVAIYSLEQARQLLVPVTALLYVDDFIIGQTLLMSRS